jgi:catechol 2,3-dioxygenase-like lactoylglutathione lyase family enzyme
MSDATPDQAPKLDQVNLVVRDMDAMAAFYEALGVKLLAGPPEWQPHHRNSDVDGGAHLDLDSTAFAPAWNRGWPEGRSGVVLGFRTANADEVDRLYGKLTAAGYVGQQEPYDAFWGARFAVVEDPDGNAVGLMSPMEQHRVSRPPDPPS